MQRTLLFFIKPPLQILENGLERVQSKLDQPLEVITSTLFQLQPNLRQKLQSKLIALKQNGAKLLSTHESHLLNNLKISNDKLTSCKKDILPILPSQTLEVGSITKGKDLKPYWNDYSKDISKKLWLPTKIDFVDSDSNSSNGYSSNLAHHWKQQNENLNQKEKILYQTLWKFLPSLQPDTTEKGSIRSKKIRIYPNTIQKQFVESCFNGHIFFYNKAIDAINQRYMARKKELVDSKTCILCNEKKEETSFMCKIHLTEKVPWNLKITLPSIRKEVLISNKDMKEPELWQQNIPYNTRQLAIKDAVTAYKSCITNKQNGNIDIFDLKPIVKKSIFWIDSNSMKIKDKKITIFPRFLQRNSTIRTRSRVKKYLPTINKSDCKIFYDNGAYYLIVSEKRKFKSRISNEQIISLDPGVRTFQTGYSPSGTCIKMGENHLELVKKLHLKIDKLKTLHGNHKRRHHIRKRLLKLEQYKYNATNDLHNQCSSMLTKTYDHILLPTFGTSQMLKSEKLSSYTKRELQSLAHYRFQMKMKQQCVKNGAKLYLISEAYTTKTCGVCGTKKNNVGTNKVYHCDKCNYVLDRDIHGARNILIRTLTTMQPQL